jgi:hypothetical protein
MKKDFKKYLIIALLFCVQLIVMIWNDTEKTENLFIRIILTELILMLMYIVYSEFKKLKK